jgi:hypothetical protein
MKGFEVSISTVLGAILVLTIIDIYIIFASH